MENKTNLPKVNWGNYGKGEFIGDYLPALPEGRCLKEVLEWMGRTVELLKKLENPKYLEDDLGGWKLPPEQYPMW